MKPDLIENGSITLHGKRHSITLDLASWQELEAQIYGPGGRQWARTQAFLRWFEVRDSEFLDADEKHFELRHAYALHQQRLIAKQKQTAALAEAYRQNRMAMAALHNCPLWRITKTGEFIADEDLTPLQQHALTHNLEPDDLCECADCAAILKFDDANWRELYGDDNLLAETPNQDPSRTEALCPKCYDDHKAEIAKLEAERDSDRLRGEVISERYHIGNGSGWNNHTTAKGIREAVFEGRAPEVSEGLLVIGGCVDREKPFGYRFAIVEIVTADTDDDRTDWYCEIAGQPVKKLHGYLVDSGTNNETHEVLAWLNQHIG